MTKSRVLNNFQIVAYEEEQPLMAREWDNPYTMVITGENGESVNLPISEETYENLVPFLEQ